MQQPHDPTSPDRFVQYPMQSGYAYDGQSPAQPQYPSGPAPHSEKLPVPVSPPMSSPSSASPDFRAGVPPYAMVHELAD